MAWSRTCSLGRAAMILFQMASASPNGAPFLVCRPPGLTAVKDLTRLLLLQKPRQSSVPGLAHGPSACAPSVGGEVGVLTPFSPRPGKSLQELCRSALL